MLASSYIVRGIERLRRSKRRVQFAFIYGMVLCVGTLDYATGDQLDLSVFYLPMVAVTVWVAGFRASLWVALLSSVLWLLDDFVVPQVPLPGLFKFWQSVMRFIVFASFAGTIGQLRIVLDREKAQARRDALTGLLNVRGFFEAAETELARARRHRRPISIAFIDCDNFKRVNDLLGHATGNELLASIGKSLAGSTRGSDLAARMGGDEFVILFAETCAEHVRAALDKSLAQLAAIMLEHDWPVTFSVGVASFPTAPDTVDELIRAADDLMYEAKRSGKNSIQELDIGAQAADVTPALAC
ncbi:MAG: GGDEF domain-containing protein [Pirellulales bacterium]|nr:GGDEF domain-containing protein [Pirellulales bacterium]